MIVKICLKHGELKEGQAYKEKNKSIIGFQWRCHQCKLEKDRRWKDLHREQHRANAGVARNERRRLYREGVTTEEPIDNIRIREDRKKDREKYREYERRHKEKLGREVYNRREVLRNHGLSLEDHDRMVKEQNNLCAICKKEEIRAGRKKGTVTPLCIDHCHKCRDEGKDDIRGLLCHGCNTALGKFKDDIELMKKAILYLEKHQCS